MRAHKLAEIFPLLEGSEFETLKADIAMKGVLAPIVTCQGEILDGRNRYRACQALGIECPAQEYTGDDPLAFVLSLNLHRRHLNESQRAMVAARLATMRQGARTDLDQPSANLPEVSQKQAAALLNVSDRLVRSAKNLQEKGSCRVIAAVDRGGVAVSTAERLAKGLETHEQDRVIDHVIENKLPPREIRREIHGIKAEKIDQARGATLKWSEEELARRERVEAGITVVANLRGDSDKHLRMWAKSKGLLVRIDRRWNWDDPSKGPHDKDRPVNWGNPFEMPADGDRDTVCDHYIRHHLPYRPSLLSEIHTLKGKVLACWCYPERCHGDYLAEWANEPDPENFKLARQMLGIVAELREFTPSANSARVLAGLKDYERSAFFANLRVIGDWIESVKETDRQGEKTAQDDASHRAPPELP